jgi:ABC-type cobalamin transport system permease subunit
LTTEGQASTVGTKVAIAGAVLLGEVARALAEPPPAGQSWISFGLAALVAAATLARRRFPAAVLLLCAAGTAMRKKQRMVLMRLARW